jgi:hypothetical protein
MSTVGLRGVLAGLLLALFGTVGGTSSYKPSVTRPAVSGWVSPSVAEAAPGLWSKARHRACLVSRAALSSDRAADRRRDCDRELLASH